MPVLPNDRSVVHEVHGSRFTSWVAPSRGSVELCAWRLDVPPGLVGAPHRPSREEVLLVLAGRLEITLDGVRAAAPVGAVVLVPAGAVLQVDGGPDGGSAWVTTTPGLQAELPDGTVLVPPWAR